MKDAAAVSPDGIPVTFETHGTGEPALVFVHGWSCDRSYWRDQVGDFARRHGSWSSTCRVTESRVRVAKWTMAAFGADVAAVVDDLGLKDVVLIGHSMGGDVVVETALLLPRRVAGLVWVDVYSTLDEDKTPERKRSSRRSARTSPRQRVSSSGSDSSLRARMLTSSSGSPPTCRRAPPEVAVDAMVHSIANASFVVNHLREMSAPVVAINPTIGPRTSTVSAATESRPS